MKKLSEEQMNCLQKCVSDQLACVTVEPDRSKHYDEELPFLKQAIIKRRYEHDEPVSKSLTFAVLEISHRRVQPRRNQGWVCGTQVIHERQAFCEWLCATFSDEELDYFVQECHVDTMESVCQQFLLLLLHHAPRVLVHPRLRQIFDT